jgi:uncharacterized hydrophobic protein (TIGR00271 family)
MMLHIRVVSPAAATGLLLARLGELPGVQNLIVLERAAHRPDGDAVFFDVHDSAANPVFRALRELGLDHDAPIAVQQVDASLTDTARSGRRIGSPAGEIAPVWEMVEATIRAGGVYSPSFFVLLAIAGLIGAVGILTNSQILIVGAMVVGPEYNAIIAAALGINKRDRGAVGEGLLALIAGFFAAIVVTLAFSAVIRAAGKAPELFLHGIRPVSDLINSPNIFSVVVAVLAGIVGVVSLTESRANALIGVFISVTTIPAAADIGVSLAFGSWHEAGGSAVQLLLNVVLLIAVGATGLSAQRAIWRRFGARKPRLPTALPRVAGGLGGSGGGLGGSGGGLRLSANGGGAVGRQHVVRTVYQSHLFGGVRPFPAYVTNKGGPPAHYRAEAVAEAGQEADVDEQPDDPGEEAGEV